MCTDQSRSLCLGVCVLLFLSWCVWRQYRSVPVPADVFRASETVRNPSQFPESVRQDMRRLLQMVPDSICGVAAPNVRVYRRFMMLRLEDGLILEVFNPEILRVRVIRKRVCVLTCVLNACVVTVTPEAESERNNPRRVVDVQANDI